MVSFANYRMNSGVARSIMRSLFLCIALVVGACSQDDNGPANIIEFPAGMPDEEGRSTSIMLSDSNWTKALLQAGHARKYNDRQETLIDSGLYAQFFDSDGSPNATLKADSARIDDKTGNMCAYQSVHVYSQKNRTIVDTEKLCYDKETGKFHSEAFVKIVDSLRGRTLQGTGFESDESLKVYTINKVSGLVNHR